jgi:hypothetical protein
MKNITYLPSLKTIRGSESWTAEQLYCYIREDGNLKALTMELWDWSTNPHGLDSKVFKTSYKVRKELLPAFIGSGVFNGLKAADIESYSGQIVLDFDDVVDMDGSRSLLTANPYVRLLFTSPSRKGLKALIRFAYNGEDPESYHRQGYQSLKAYYSNGLYPPIDNQNESDLPRKCFIAWDPDAYFNPDSLEWNFSYVVPTAVDDLLAGYIPDPQLNNTILKESNRGYDDDVTRLVHLAEDNVSHPFLRDYNDSIDLVFAVKNTYGEGPAGFNAFTTLMSTSSHYRDPKKIAEKWKIKGRPSGRRITLASIIYKTKNV